MPRKRQEGVTTPSRYKGKMYAVGFGIFHGNVEIANDYADALTYARASGYAPFKMAWQEVQGVLKELNVPSAQWGLYKAAVNEYVNKVQRKKQMSRDEWSEKWTKNGLDGRILDEIARRIGEVIAPPAPTPAAKTA
jgi:hypothetical protein